MLELKLRSAREEFDTGLEVALAESLKKYQQQTVYWNEKMATAAAQQDALKVSNAFIRPSFEKFNTSFLTNNNVLLK